ncbi:MAG: tetratricopeptide repeat protein [Deltaproteobacteria bacterium]
MDIRGGWHLLKKAIPLWGCLFFAAGSALAGPGSAAYDSGKRLAEEGRDTEAIAAFSEALSQEPGLFDAYYRRGLCYQRTGEDEKAAADLTEAINRGERTAAMVIERGRCFQRMGRNLRAIADFRLAREIDPKDREALYSLAVAYSEFNDMESALAEFEGLLAAFPDFGQGYADRALVFFKKNDYSRAWDDVKKAQELGVQVSPGLLEALRNESGGR